MFAMGSRSGIMAITIRFPVRETIIIVQVPVLHVTADTAFVEIA